jgi:hypothetical protein
VSRLGAITRFASGTYTVSRYAAPAWVAGVATKATPSTLSIVASVQPVSGREIAALPEGRRANEVRVVYTSTALRTEGVSGGSADTISIDGEVWEVFKLETWSAWSETHYRAFISRVAVP